MGLINFVANYDDLSTDRGYQFRFRCDKCGNGHMTRYKASTLGMAQSLLNVAGSLFGGMGSMGNAAYEVQRAVGGQAHDAALAEAVEEARASFRQCTRCGKWVCPEVCWNGKVNLCEGCAPDYQEELAASHAQAKAQATSRQLHEKAEQTPYVSGVDTSADAHVAAQTAATNLEPAKRVCSGCGSALEANSKFCGECGQRVAEAGPKTCDKCGTVATAKFCPECGERMR